MTSLQHDLHFALALCLRRSAHLHAQVPYSDVAPVLRELGLEPGWGNNVGRIRATLSSLLDLLQAPDAAGLEGFLSRLPIVHKVAIMSPHGFFGQKGVLGKPDTGGQVWIRPIGGCNLGVRGCPPGQEEAKGWAWGEAL